MMHKTEILVPTKREEEHMQREVIVCFDDSKFYLDRYLGRNIIKELHDKIIQLRLFERRISELETALRREQQVIYVEEKPFSELLNATREFIKNKKSQGYKEIDDFELMEKFQIPIEQVDKILLELKKEGLVNEPVS